MSQLAELSDQEIANMLLVKSQADIAREFGISRQAVSSYLDRHGIADKYRYRLHRDKIPDIGRLTEQGLTMEKIAEKLNISSGIVFRIRRDHGFIPPDRKIPCDKCKTDHYARGLCRACYAFAQYHDRKDEFALTTKNNRTTRRQVPCPDCANSLNTRGLCKTCYNCVCGRGELHKYPVIRRMRKPRKTPCPNCETKHHARGYCKSCYEYKRKRGELIVNG